MIDGLGDSGDDLAATEVESDDNGSSDSEVGTTAGESGSTETTGTGSESGSTETTGTESETGPLCGDGLVEGDEACDDGNDDESDGCLSTCVVPRSCAEIQAELPASGSGVYTITPDGAKMQAYCDMKEDGGGWTLIAKVNRAETDDLPEPPGWFGAPMNVGDLTSPTLSVDGPLASHGGQRFAAVLTPQSLARFVVVAADDPDQRANFYKRVASAKSLASWFADDDVGSEVCTDVDMTADCATGVIAVEGDEPGLVYLGNMDLAHHGYETIDDTALAMRLDDNGASAASGICSLTLDNQSNAWHDSYRQHWGNGLLVWLR